MNRNIIKIITLVLITILSLCVIFYFYSIKSNCTEELLNIALDKEEYAKIITCANKNVPDAILILCKLHEQGKGVEKDHKKAINFCKKAAEKDNSLAMIELGDIYSSGNLELRDYNEARKWYQQAIDTKDDNSLKAMHALSYYYIRKFWHQKDGNDIKLSMEWLEKSANNSYIPAIHDIAAEYREGEFVRQDYQKSKEWLEKAVDLGDVKSLRSIGNIYANGSLGDADYEQAALWYQKAADRGDVISKDFLKPNPSPFGLEITKATISDFKRCFPNHQKSQHPNKYNNGSTFAVNKKYIKLGGVKGDVFFLFNKNEVLEAVLIMLNSDQKYEVKNSLESKYKLFMANSNRYDSGNTEIYLYEYDRVFSRFDSYYNSKFITVIYQSRAFSILAWKYDKEIEKANDREKQNQRDLL